MKKAHVKKILLKDKIYIRKEDIDEDNLSILKQNTHYLVADDEIFTTFDEDDNFYTIPANAYNKLTWDDLEDARHFKRLENSLEFLGKLRPEQQDVLDTFIGERKDRIRSGILQGKCGFGKTYVACSLIAKNNTPTIILVHTRLLFYQWINEIKEQLGIDPGKVGDSLFEVKDITVAIYKTANNRINELKDRFSTIIVDECHLAPADIFSQTLNQFSAKTKVGMSATPTRKDLKHQALPDFFSTFEVKAKEERVLATPRVAIQKTDLPFNVTNPKAQWAKMLTTLGKNDNYLNYIAEYAIADITKNRCPLILSERVGMLQALEKKIKGSVCLVGNTPEETRQEILQNAGSKYKAILSTKIFDEGISCHRLDTLYLTCPSNNPMKLEQRIGRIIREHPEKQLPLIRDFWLKGIIVSKQQQNRLDWYRDQGYVVI